MSETPTPAPARDDDIADWWPTPGVEEHRKCGCSFTRLGKGWLHVKCETHGLD